MTGTVAPRVVGSHLQPLIEALKPQILHSEAQDLLQPGAPPAMLRRANLSETQKPGFHLPQHHRPIRMGLGIQSFGVGPKICHVGASSTSMQDPATFQLIRSLPSQVSVAVEIAEDYTMHLSGATTFLTDTMKDLQSSLPQARGFLVRFYLYPSLHQLQQP